MASTVLVAFATGPQQQVFWAPSSLLSTKAPSDLTMHRWIEEKVLIPNQPILSPSESDAPILHQDRGSLAFWLLGPLAAVQPLDDPGVALDDREGRGRGLVLAPERLVTAIAAAVPGLLALRVWAAHAAELEGKAFEGGDGGKLLPGQVLDHLGLESAVLEETVQARAGSGEAAAEVGVRAP